VKPRITSRPEVACRIRNATGAGPIRRAALLSFLVSAIGLLSLASAGPASAVNPNQVVALTPFSANAMALMGAYPAAVGQTLGGDRRLVSGLRSTPVLKLSHPMGPNREELALYAPELIFTSPQWSRGRSMMESMAGRVVDADPKTVQGVYSKTRQIGSLVGRKARASRLVRTMKRQVAKARNGINRRVRVMMILGVGRTPFVFLDNSWGGQIVKLAGGRLLTGGATSSGGFAKIGDDVVVAERPDVIIAVPHSESDNIPDTIRYLKTNPAWASTPAVKKKRVFISTDNSLLQAGTDIGRTISIVRKQYLKNG
jgi:iron complex transport system substrate-binding protein